MASLNRYMQAMRKSFVPDRTRGVHAVLQYCFTGAVTGSCYTSIDDGKLDVQAGTHPEPSAIVHADYEQWKRVLAYEEDPLLAFQSGQFQVDGDIELLLVSDSWFTRQIQP